MTTAELRFDFHTYGDSHAATALVAYDPERVLSTLGVLLHTLTLLASRLEHLITLGKIDADDSREANPQSTLVKTRFASH